MRKGTGTMVVSELITLVNVESNEILDEQLEYIQYINAAIDWLTTILVSIKDREVVKNMDIPDKRAVPSDFGTFETYDGETVNQVFYSVRKNHIDDLDDTIPFSEFFHQYLVQLISFMVKKKSLMTDYAAYDKTFIDYITEQIKTARGIT